MTIGTVEPVVSRDLETWQTWQKRRRRLSRALHTVRRAAGTRPVEPQLQLTGTPDADVVVGFDTTNPPMVRTFEAVIRALQARGTTVSAVDAGDARLRPLVDAPTSPLNPGALHASTYVSIGHFAPVGHAVWRASRRQGGRFVVLQHGLLTPFVPPLASGSHLLAWTSADAQYWSAARADVTSAVVWSAPLAWARQDSAESPRAVAHLDRPLFLGQMHGAELSWPTKITSALTFCTQTGADYRPHPSEISLLSRSAHRALRTAGVTVAIDAAPLTSVDRPLVSMFSTGLVEAAAAGLRTYGFAQSPPRWLNSFWDRYRIGTWPHTPTQVDPTLLQHTPETAVDAIVHEVAP